MNLEALNCNNCGAPINVPPTANFVTCKGCGAQLIIRRTEEATYTELAPAPVRSPAPATQPVVQLAPVPSAPIQPPVPDLPPQPMPQTPAAQSPAMNQAVAPIPHYTQPQGHVTTPQAGPVASNNPPPTAPATAPAKSVAAKPPPKSQPAKNAPPKSAPAKNQPSKPAPAKPIAQPQAKQQAAAEAPPVDPAHLDQDWEAQRVKLLLDWKGNQYVPSMRMGLLLGGGLIAVGLAIIFVCNFVIGRYSEFLLPIRILGIIVMMAGTLISLHIGSKAQRYQKAHDTYQQRRQAAVQYQESQQQAAAPEQSSAPEQPSTPVSQP